MRGSITLVEAKRAAQSVDGILLVGMVAAMGVGWCDRSKYQVTKLQLRRGHCGC